MKAHICSFGLVSVVAVVVVAVVVAVAVVDVVISEVIVIVVVSEVVVVVLALLGVEDSNKWPQGKRNKTKEH